MIAYNKPKQCCVCQHQKQGDLSAAQGDQSQSQGEQAQNQGDLSAAQGNLTETMGDMYQTQGGETQGDQIQGEQIQGDQTHGDQIQGDQTLSSSPTISTPVNVSGVNVNIEVSCCDKIKKHHNDCKKECRDSIYSLLSLINTFSQAITDPESSQLVLYYSGTPDSSIEGNLNKVSECTFTILTSSESERTFLTDSLEALLIESIPEVSNLFSLLISYLESVPNLPYLRDDCNDKSQCCYKEIALQLQAYYIAQINLEIFLTNTSFTGFIYKINNNIVYLVDDLNDPTLIYAIPICKILSYQPVNIPL